MTMKQGNPITANLIVIVDSQDLHLLSDFRWDIQKAGKTFYLARKEKTGFRKYRKVYLHRMIANPPIGYEVDHINRNGLDNTRDNLRVVTHRENMKNMRQHSDSNSRFRGVYLFKPTGKWQAQICNDHKRFHLGYFDSEIEAAKEYDRAAIRLHGEFANLNFCIGDCDEQTG